MKKILKVIGIIIASMIGFLILLFTIFGILFGFGTVGVKLSEAVGIQYVDMKREQFENSTSYIHSMTDRLSEYKRQYSIEADVDNKLAILNTIDDEYASFDESKIDNSTLRTFLQDVRDGTLKEQLLIEKDK